MGQVTYASVWIGIYKESVHPAQRRIEIGSVVYRSGIVRSRKKR